MVTTVKKGCILLLCLTVWSSFIPCSTFLYGQTSTKVALYNKGKIYVSPNPQKASLYIQNAIHVKGNSEITQQGTTVIGGDFYHDAVSTVFKKNENETFPSKGKIVFARDNAIRRYITTKDNPIKDFNRANYYIAFPEIEIETSDTIVIPFMMGIDARKITQTNSLSGKILLESDTIQVGEPLLAKVYDASLRLTGTKEANDSISENSSDLVPPGAVIVERDLTPYRVENQEEPGAGLLFAFASPFKDQRSGYFAGNWIRRMLETSDGHVQYVYGNKRNGATDVILPEQYISNPTEEFVAGKGYLVKLRRTSFSYNSLVQSGGLPITNSDTLDYEQRKFVFDGKPYTLDYTNEQLFADDTLFHREVNLPEKRSSAINWVIGNSYTAPINLSALIDLIEISTLKFEPNLYVFPHGSTTYQIYKVQPNENSMDVIDIDEIPSMSYFMLRLNKTPAQNGSLTLRRKDLLKHGTASHNLLKSATASRNLRSAKMPYNNEILLKISPESNPNIYDLAGIGLRQNGNPNADNNDIDKSIGSDELFSIYTEAPDGRKLSANILPETTESVPLFVSPGSTGGRFLLQVSRMESLRTEGLWLEDLLEQNRIYDLTETDGRHVFYSNPNDLSRRFIVHFKQAITGVDTPSEPFLQVYYSNGQLKIRGLNLTDVGSTLRIINMQGQTLQSKKIAQVPETNIDISLSPGIYIAKLEGQRSITVKFKK